jgi:putative oxidoreductase
MDYGLLIIRLAVAVVMVFHGTEKLFGWWGGEGLDGAASFFGRMGIRPPRLMAFVAGLTETTGGVLFGLGAVTALAAAMLFGTLVNVLALHWRNGFSRRNNGFEYEFVLLAAAACIGFTGPGQLSADAVLGLPAGGVLWGLAASRRREPADVG